MAYTLRVRRLRGRDRAAGPQRGDLGAERPGHGERGPVGLVDGAHVAGLLEAAERGVQRAERHRRAGAHQLTELLLHLVAVERLVGEEPEEGEFEHADISIRCIVVMCLGECTGRDRGCQAGNAQMTPRCDARPRPPLPAPVRARPLACRDAQPARPGVRRGARTPGEIDYRLARQSLISEYRKGRLARHEVCDAHSELRRNATSCGSPTTRRCPICTEHDVVLVTYVFGPRLPANGRCITKRRRAHRHRQASRPVRRLRRRGVPGLLVEPPRAVVPARSRHRHGRLRALTRGGSGHRPRLLNFMERQVRSRRSLAPLCLRRTRP